MFLVRPRTGKAVLTQLLQDAVNESGLTQAEAASVIKSSLAETTEDLRAKLEAKRLELARKAKLEAIRADRLARGEKPLEGAELEAAVQAYVDAELTAPWGDPRA